MLKWGYGRLDAEVKIIDERSMEQYWKDIENKSEWGDGDSRWKIPEGWKKVEALCARSRKRKEQRKKGENDTTESSEDIDLPSWVPRAKNAPFEIYRHPGIQINKTGRANADPLVGWPQDGHRNYGAAQTETVKLDCLRFKKRPDMGHYSLYLAGFKVDEVKEVRDASQGGSIPNSWLELSGWKSPYNGDPPAEFWRTIVADRGFDNRNPPYYHARACRESVKKGGRESGSVNTTALINNEQNSIIAEFCRRVHAVIWGRSLFKTMGGKLGLAKDVKEGDLVCILHGCTVPVILSQRSKEPGELEREEIEDQYEAFKSCYRRMENICVRKKRYRDQKEKHRKQEEEQQETQKVRDEEENVQLSTWEYLKGTLVRWFRRPANTSREISRWEQDVISAQSKANKILQVDCEARQEQQANDKRRREVLKPQNNDNGENKDLRPRFTQDKDTFYLFKGESYVHGCMDGEAVRNRFYGTEEEWIYELR